MSAATTLPGLSLTAYLDLVELAVQAADEPLRLRMMSVTSSLTPVSVENSCATPSILTEVTAAPSSDESSTRRSELPNV
jgi:hypothetical protein